LKRLYRHCSSSRIKNIPNEQQHWFFIDEIQEIPEAFNMLRYFLEQFPEIAVIAAGSLLETIFDARLSFPVGRVELLIVRSVSFPEFLGAIGENAALNQLQQVPLRSFTHEKLLRLFHT
jgi:hypothetical protein